MFKVIATIATAVAALFMFAGTANASEVTTSNDASEGDYSYSGTSNETSSSNTSTGHVIATPPAHTLLVVGYTPMLDADGNIKYREDGETPYLSAIYGWVPTNVGPAPATIVHN